MPRPVTLPDTIRRSLEASGRLPAEPAGARPRSTRPPRASDDWPGDLAGQARMAGLPAPVREYRFAVELRRRWRFDLAWPDHWLAVEVDGGTWVGGRHTSGQGFEQDCVKLNEALCLGWRVLRVTPRHVKSGEALGWLERALG